jgi:replication initiation protein RepC
METTIATTPFGQRPISLGQIVTQINTKRLIEEAGKPGSNHPAAVNKWQILRTLQHIREQLGVSDRALSVLHALLSFHQETALTLPKVSNRPQKSAEEKAEQENNTSNDLVVFPSNKALSLRANGMAAATLRRHIAQLVEAGLIIRRDSPNGKRYARKDITGAERFSDVFGFDLTPLVTRVPQFEAMEEEVKRAARTRAMTKERISLLRRDVNKLIACGLDEGLSGEWNTYRERFMRLVIPLRRILQDHMLEQLVDELTMLRQEVTITLEQQIKSSQMSANAPHSERHQSNTNSKYHSDFEPAFTKQGDEASADDHFDGFEIKSCQTASDLNEGDTASSKSADPIYPLGLVLEACPDVKDYGAGGMVRSWSAFMEAVRLIRPMLGISPDAWRNARAALGDVEAHIVVASILQRSEYSSEAALAVSNDGLSSSIQVNGSPAIKSAGGYLRALTEKAGQDAFALGPVLMALIGQRLKAKRDK